MNPETAELGPQIKIIKFMSGQEVVARVIGGDGIVYVLESPLTVQPVRQGDKIGMALTPFSLAGNADKQVTVASLHVTCMMDPDEQFKTHYLANIAGIELPTNSPGPRISLTD